MLAFVRVLCVATQSTADWVCPLKGFYWALSVEADCPLRGVLSKQHRFGAFFPERDRTTCHISWELWQMGHSGCCWGVWSCFSPGAEFPILALILGMACLCVVLPRSLSMYLAVCCTCCWKCCALFPPLKKKAVKWKETSQRLLSGQHCYISFTPNLLLHNASAKWMLY